MSHLIDYFLAWEISEYIILFIIEDPVQPQVAQVNQIVQAPLIHLNFLSMKNKWT